MKKLLLALAILLFTFATPSFAATEAVGAGQFAGDKFFIKAKNTSLNQWENYMHCETGASPFCNMRNDMQFDGQTLSAHLSGFATSGAAAALDARIDSLEGSGFSGDYNDLTNLPSLFSGAYVDLTGKPTIPSTFDQLLDGLTNVAFTNTLKLKLNGIASNATMNSSDTFLVDRANHTGTQLMSTISDLQSALDAKQDVIAPAAAIADVSDDVTTSLETDYSPSSGYTTIINDGINASNAAQNDLATKFNDLAAKFNTLMDHLEAQGLQLP